jgi:hypothetical protein
MEKQIKMNARAALCMALLDGQVLNVKNVFKTIGLTNASREISRMVESPFDVEVSRTPRKGKSRYGCPVTWIDYRLNKSERNIPGIQKMQEYIQKHTTASVNQSTHTQSEPKTELQTNKLF